MSRMPQILGPNGTPLRDYDAELDQLRAIVRQQAESLGEMADRLGALTDAASEATPGLRENFTGLFAEKAERRKVMQGLFVDDPPLEDFAARVTAWNEEHPGAPIGAAHFPVQWIVGKLTGEGTMGRARRKAFALRIGVKPELCSQWFGGPSDLAEVPT